jgi:uncharacterized C2H2 Zn-finger protein
MGYRCPLCKGLFNSFHSLKIHIIKSHAHKVCQLCGKETKNLTMHYRMMAKNDFLHLIVSCIVTECTYIDDGEIRRLVINLVKVILDENIPLDIISKKANQTENIKALD